MSRPALHPELAPISFIACIATLLPLPWHWRARNVATLSIIFWFFVSNLVFGVDAAVWSNNVTIRIPVWCDISENFRLLECCPEAHSRDSTYSNQISHRRLVCHPCIAVRHRHKTSSGCVETWGASSANGKRAQGLTYGGRWTLCRSTSGRNGSAYVSSLGRLTIRQLMTGCRHCRSRT